MPISEPELRPSDTFHVVGFTEAEVKSGAISRALGIAEEGFRTVAALGRKGSPLWHAAQEERVTKLLIEIYFLDVRRSPHVNFPGKNIERFWMVHFYNDAACEIIRATSLELPPMISTVSRANLPTEVGVGVRDYYFKILSA
jgi:hypothetical protein